MRHFLYDEHIKRFCGDVIEAKDAPLNSTLVTPPKDKKQMTIVWHADLNEWKYHEVVNTNFQESDHMDELLDYATIRVLEYPPKEDYLDAVVKNDEQQMSAYIQSCQDVKAKWPKDMAPITRREYSISALGMIPWNPNPVSI